jgi:flagellar biosynthesis/type III secretory pathway protein FliH
VSPLGRARIVRGGEPAHPDGSEDVVLSVAAPVLVSPGRQRRIVHEEVTARLAAVEIVGRARAEADAIVQEAKQRAEGVAREAAQRAREEEEAKLAGLYLHLRREDDQRADRDLDRAVGLAVILAERLLGSALQVDPKLVVQLARQSLAEARGSRRVVIRACPLDVDALQAHLVAVGFESHTVEVQADDDLTRGSLRLTTNLGTLDAQLRPQLERLAHALRETVVRT